MSGSMAYFAVAFSLRSHYGEVGAAKAENQAPTLLIFRISSIEDADRRGFRAPPIYFFLELHIIK